MRVGIGTLALSIVAFLFVPLVASANQRLTIQRQLVAAAAPASQLQQVESVESFGTRFYRFRQEVAGVPVLGAETIVTDAPGRQADLLLDLSRPGIERRPPQRVVSRVSAIAAARVEARVERLRTGALASLSILPRSSGGRLVWRVILAGLEFRWEALRCSSMLARRRPFASEICSREATGTASDLRSEPRRRTRIALRSGRQQRRGQPRFHGAPNPGRAGTAQ